MTTSKTTIPISEGRRRLFEIADEVYKANIPYTLTADGKPKIVILSAEEYESMIETLEVQRIFPDLDKDVAEVEKAFKTGEYKKWATLEDIEKKYANLVVAEKPKRKYGIQNNSVKKGRKSSR